MIQVHISDQYIIIRYRKTAEFTPNSTLSICDEKVQDCVSEKLRKIQRSFYNNRADIIFSGVCVKYAATHRIDELEKEMTDFLARIFGTEPFERRTYEDQMVLSEPNLTLVTPLGIKESIEEIKAIISQKLEKVESLKIDEERADTAVIKNELHEKIVLLQKDLRNLIEDNYHMKHFHAVRCISSKVKSRKVYILTGKDENRIRSISYGMMGTLWREQRIKEKLSKSAIKTQEL